MRARVWAVAAVAATFVGAGNAQATTTKPAVTSFTPTAAAPTAVVTVTGSRFTNAATVSFNGTTAATTFVSSTKVTAVVPDGATSGPITVTTAGGTSNPSAASFTVLPAPTVDSFDPTAQKIGGRVTITGTGFVGVTKVMFGDVKSPSFTLLSSTSVKATVPTGATDGPITVYIHGASGSSADDFHVVLPPKITSFTPAYSAAGNTVTISGKHLDDVTSVLFGTIPAADFAHPDDSTLTATVPDGAVTAKIVVSDVAGTSTSLTPLTIVSPPTVTGFTPTSGHSGTTVTITGTNFKGATGVQIGGSDVWSYTVVSATKITAIAGPNLTNAPVQVENAADTGTSADNFDGSAFDLVAEMGSSFYDTLDPAFAFTSSDWQLLYPTCLGLTRFADAPAPAGFQVLPDAAVSMPAISPDGLTYTFTLRQGLALSNGEAVTPSAFYYSITRALQTGYASYILNPNEIENIVPDDDTGTLAITLSKPEPDLTEQLAMPFFCATSFYAPNSDQGVSPQPAGGPYYVSDVSGNTITLDRNPNYSGSRPAYPDEVTITQNVGSSQILSDIAGGAADWESDSLTQADATTAQTNSPNQVVQSPYPGFEYFALNTQYNLFKSAAARKAFSLVINRTQLKQLWDADNGIVTDQYLSAASAGFTDAKIWPLNGPSATQLATAKSLAQQAGIVGKTAELWTCGNARCLTAATMVQTALGKIGVSVNITQKGNTYFSDIGTEGAPYDIAGPQGWIANYNDPDQLLNILLDGTTIQANNNTNFAYWNNPTYNAKLEAAAALPLGSKRWSTYGTLEQDIVANQAPLASFMNYTSFDMFGTRIGCRVNQPEFGTDYAALCAS